MSAPKVSVVVPVYNAGEKIVSTVQSLLGQSLTLLEIILVNDASSDNSAEIINALAETSNRVIAVHLNENSGVHEARLAGLRRASAPWIGFLDADDYARPEMFDVLLMAAESNNVDIVVCGSDRVTSERKIISPKLRFSSSKKVSKDVFQRFCKFDFGTGMLWNKLFKRSVIEPWFDLHFPWRQSINEDLLLNIGCFYQARSVYLLSDVLHEYVFDKNSVTSKMESGWAYVETFRAYVLAVTSYQHLGARALFSIIEMYRNQISWDTYRVPCSDDLNIYRDRLEEAVRMLCDQNPYALAAIASRGSSDTVGARLAFKSLGEFALRRLRRLVSF